MENKIDGQTLGFLYKHINEIVSNECSKLENIKGYVSGFNEDKIIICFEVSYKNTFDFQNTLGAYKQIDERHYLIYHTSFFSLETDKLEKQAIEIVDNFYQYLVTTFYRKS